MTIRLLFTLFILTAFQLPAQVRISTDSGAPAASAGLDVDFSDKGFLPPRMTTAQRNSLTPAAGLQIYNTDIQCIEFYNGTLWYNLCAADPCNAAPAAPAAAVHSSSQTQITWNWATSLGATLYRYNTVNDFAGSQTTLLTTWTQTGSFFGSYSLYVWAVNACGVSPVTQLTHTQCPVPGNSYAGGIVAYATGCTGYVTTTASFGPSTYAAANTYCNDLVSGGYSDWTLPNITVLGQMHANRTAIGGFANNVFYWSSTSVRATPTAATQAMPSAHGRPAVDAPIHRPAITEVILTGSAVSGHTDKRKIPEHG
jgi:hypothetical protein